MLHIKTGRNRAWPQWHLNSGGLFSESTVSSPVLYHFLQGHPLGLEESHFGMTIIIKDLTLIAGTGV